jgi:alpha-beta hydrolase superfamily lysophospholipase
VVETGPRFFTDGAGRTLFGWLHAPEVAPRGIVVLCPPVGYDAICSHAALRTLAEKLAAAGLVALRIDYHGTGDSAGCDRDPDRVPAWRASIEAGIAHAKQAAGAPLPITLFGVRLGATLALDVACNSGGIDGLVLWSPAVTGRAYVREVRAFRKLLEAEVTGAPRDAPGRGPDDEESAGFLLSASTVAALSAIEFSQLASPPARRALVIGRDDLPGGEDKLVQRLTAAGVEVRAPAVAGYAAMMQDPHKAVPPTAVFDAMLAWLDAPTTPVAVAAPQPGLPFALSPAASGAEVREEPLFLGPRGLFGMLTSPLTPPSDRPIVVFLNAGAIYHIGPNRMAVSLARAWATRGYTSLRLDLGGLGDSPTAAPRRNGPPVTGLADGVASLMYSTAVVADVEDALQALVARRIGSRFVLVGLCSGAYVAYHSSLKVPEVVGQVLINPQTFAFKDGDSLEVGARRDFAESRRYQRTLFKKEAWQKVLRGQVNFRYFAGVMTRRAQSLVETRLSRVLDQLHLRPSEGRALAQSFRAIGDRGTQTFMVFSGDDPGLGYVEDRLGPRLASLRRARGVHLDIIEGPDHTFTPLWSQHQLASILTRRLESLH